MIPDRGEAPPRHAARLPAVLLICYFALVAAVVLWLTLAAPGNGGGGPLQRAAADIALGPGAIPTAPAPESKPRPPTPQQARSTAPPKPEAPAPAEDAPSPAHPPPLELNLPSVKPGPKLAAAPDPDLVRPGPQGPLPVISTDGRAAWRVYARPFNRADKRPRIAIVLHGLGINRAATQAAITGLPGAVTLAFSPYAKGLDRWVREARAVGHEVVLNLPMEPTKFRQIDVGPQALLTSLESDQNIRRLEWVLGRATGYVGVINTIGTRFAGSSRHLRPVLEALKSRGLMYLDTVPDSVVPRIGPQIALPWAVGETTVDESMSREAIDRRLAELEKVARRIGRVIGLGNPYAVTIGTIAWWITGLEDKGIALAPVSAMAFRKPRR